MIELWKSLIEHLLSWPVSIFFTSLVFKRPLSRLIRRVTSLSIKGGGLEASVAGEATKQLEADKRSTKDPLAPATETQLTLPLPEEIKNRRALVQAFGGDGKLIVSQIQEVKDDLKRLQFQVAEDETTEVLIRHLAVTQLMQRAEFLYRVIYGSQIALLQALKQRGSQPETSVRAFYDKARRRSPQFYGDYTFEQWVGFLVKQQVLIFENERYGITLGGSEFLDFVTIQALPKKAH